MLWHIQALSATAHAYSTVKADTKTQAKQRGLEKFPGAVSVIVIGRAV
jgi:hypothetical protein